MSSGWSTRDCCDTCGKPACGCAAPPSALVSASLVLRSVPYTAPVGMNSGERRGPRVSSAADESLLDLVMFIHRSTQEPVTLARAEERIQTEIRDSDEKEAILAYLIRFPYDSEDAVAEHEARVMHSLGVDTPEDFRDLLECMRGETDAVLNVLNAVATEMFLLWVEAILIDLKSFPDDAQATMDAGYLAYDGELRAKYDELYNLARRLA